MVCGVREPNVKVVVERGASKHKGELALASMAQDIDWIALRPPAVYGPGDKEMLPLLQLMGRGIAPVLGAAHARVQIHPELPRPLGAVQRQLRRPRRARPPLQGLKACLFPLG